MTDCAENIRVMYPLFQAGKGGSIPTSALCLRFERIESDLATTLNRLWHSRLPKFTNAVTLRICYGAEFDGLLYAVALWSHPVARLLPQRTWLELRRFAIAPDAPKYTASRMLGWMAKNVARRFPELVRLVSYQDKEVHTGTIYKACGWSPVTLADPRSRPWNNAARCRNEEQSRSPKQRWEKELA